LEQKEFKFPTQRTRKNNPNKEQMSLTQYAESLLNAGSKPSERVRVEILPESTLDLPSLTTKTPEIFLERFVDEDDLTLLKRNYWLRERIYSSSNKSEYVLSHVYNTPDPSSMNVLCCQQWTSVDNIEKTLSSVFSIPGIGYLTNTIAKYHVFRYHFHNGCTLDQTVFDLSNVKQRHESISLRFASLADLRTFANDFGDWTLPTYSKAMAYIQQRNENARDVLRSLGQSSALPTKEPIYPDPDVSLWDENVRFDDEFAEGESDAWLLERFAEIGVSLEEVLSYNSRPMTLEGE